MSMPATDTSTLKGTSTALNGLARKLVQDGLLDEGMAQEAQEKAESKKTPLVRYLVENNILDSTVIANAASQEFGIPLFDINAMDLEQCAYNLVDQNLIQKHSALPLYKRGNRLYVAVSDPTNLQALDEIKFNVGANAEPILVEDDKLRKIIEKIMEENDTTMDDLGDADLDALDITGGDENNSDADEPDIDDTPIVRFVNKVLLDAINKGASDLHFEPYEYEYRVRFRMDGILTEMSSPPPALANKISARIKVMSQLDISERRVPTIRAVSA